MFAKINKYKTALILTFIAMYVFFTVSVYAADNTTGRIENQEKRPDNAVSVENMIPTALQGFTFAAYLDGTLLTPEKTAVVRANGQKIYESKLRMEEAQLSSVAVANRKAAKRMTYEKAAANRIAAVSSETKEIVYPKGNVHPYIQSDTYPMKYVSADKGTVIEITQERHHDSDCYLAHIITSDPQLLKTCLASGAPTSLTYDTMAMTEVAARENAIFMINSDYTAGDYFGYAIREGNLIRTPNISRPMYPSLYMGYDGHFSYYAPASESIRNSFHFAGTILIQNERPLGVGQGNLRRNPRTFLGEVTRTDGLLEYYLVVADGRSSTNAGLAYWQEADILFEKGCSLAYNLDGGGSSEMVFNGKILNEPSDGHERLNHDFMYVKL